MSIGYDFTIVQAAQELRVFPDQIELWLETGMLPDAYVLTQAGEIRIPRAGVETLNPGRHDRSFAYQAEQAKARFVARTGATRL